MFSSPSQLNHIEKRRKLTHKPINNWSFNKDLNATSEILADIGVTLLEDDDDDSQSGALECLGPTPPCGAPTTLNSPPKVQ